MSELDLRTLRCGVLLNKSSGSCDDAAEKTLADILRRSDVEPTVTKCVEGPKLDATLNDITDNGIDVLIVLGGDGTIRAAAERCGARNITLLPLPGGTMNMLPTALYGKCDWATALSKTLSRPSIRQISAGEVEGKRFYCAGIFGAPSLWSDAREAVRANNLTKAFHHAVNAYHRMFSRSLAYRFDSKPTAFATAVTAICPLISTAISSAEPALEAAAMDIETAREAFKLAVNAVISDWRLDEKVKSAKATKIRISSRASIPAILDGERVRLKRTADIIFTPAGFDALVPSGRCSPINNSSKD